MNNLWVLILFHNRVRPVTTDIGLYLIDKASSPLCKEHTHILSLCVYVRRNWWWPFKPQYGVSLKFGSSVPVEKIPYKLLNEFYHTRSALAIRAEHIDTRIRVI